MVQWKCEAEARQVSRGFNSRKYNDHVWGFAKFQTLVFNLFFSVQIVIEAYGFSLDAFGVQGGAAAIDDISYNTTAIYQCQMSKFSIDKAEKRNLIFSTAYSQTSKRHKISL